MTHHRQRLIRDAVACGLTDREAEVLALYSEDRTAEGVAMRLGISVNTVNHHLQSARNRLDVSSTVALLTVIAYRKAA